METKDQSIETIMGLSRQIETSRETQRIVLESQTLIEKAIDKLSEIENVQVSPYAHQIATLNNVIDHNVRDLENEAEYVTDCLMDIRGEIDRHNS